MNNTFKIGDRVRGIKPVEGNHCVVDAVGTVVCFSISTGRPGIEFDKSFEKGHNLNFQCRDGHGFYMRSDALEEYSDMQPDIFTGNISDLLSL